MINDKARLRSGEVVRIRAITPFGLVLCSLVEQGKNSEGCYPQKFVKKVEVCKIF